MVPASVTIAMAFLGAIISFVVGLLVGGLALYLAARVILGVDDYERAVITALLGAIVWGVTSLIVGWVPLLGPLIVLVAWVGVIKWRYPGGWVDAAIVGFAAWAAAAVGLFVLATVGVDVGAVGIPGV